MLASFFKLLTNPRHALIALGGLAMVAAGIWVLFQDALFRSAIRPPGLFATSPSPPPPDYAKPDSWALRPPYPPPGGWEKPWGVDVFFVHPTSAYAGDDWNAPIDDPASSSRLAQVILPNFASPFAKAGPVYAPRYRQASLWSELNVGGQGDGAFLVAYNDVLAAFDHYVAVDNRQRGVLLAGVGQGGLYVQKLLQDRFQSGPLMERFAGAYIIDAAVPSSFPGKTVLQPVCRSADQIRCIAAWLTSVGAEDGADRRRNGFPVWDDGEVAASRGQDLVCVNPLDWTTGDHLAPRTAHRGAARAGPSGDPEILAGAVAARCRNGRLEVSRPSAPELQRGAAWGAQYKTPEFNLFYADILMNASDRMRNASVWLEANVRKPAEPLPPAITLEEEGIHRPTGEPQYVPQSGD